VRRSDTDAKAVWTYADAILDVRCLAARDCELRAWEPRGVAPLWRVAVPGVGFVLFADNPPMPGTRPLTGDAIDSGVAGPARLPGVIGFPADGGLHLVDTAAGAVVRVLDLDPRRERITVAGGRVLAVTATAKDGTCYFAVTATDARGGHEVWRADGLNLRTAGDGARCAQEKDPAGGQDVLLGVDPAGREQLVDAHDGRRLWRGGPGDAVLAVDDRRALTRSGTTLEARDFARAAVAWRRRAGEKTQAALSPYAAVVVDPASRRVAALRLSTGAVLAELRTDARVLAVGPGGLVLGERRQLAYLPFSGVSTT
jgi:outer membrane protein assembly factor BamB